MGSRKDGMTVHDKVSIVAGKGIFDGADSSDKMSAAAAKFLRDKAGPVGLLVGVLRDKDGNVKDRQEAFNQFQTLGKTHVADRLADVGEAAMGWMAIGTGTGQGVGDNVLATELDRQALDDATPSHAANVVTYHRLFAAGEGTGTVTEAGVFNDNAAGSMFVYDDGISFAKGASDTLALTWTFTIN